MPGNEPTASQKRSFYVVAFCVAFGVDLAINLGRGLSYRPSLIGLAIMITAVIWFVWSLVRGR